MSTCAFVYYLCLRLTSVSRSGPIALNSYGRQSWMRFTYNGLADGNVGWCPFSFQWVRTVDVEHYTQPEKVSVFSKYIIFSNIKL